MAPPNRARVPIVLAVAVTGASFVVYAVTAARHLCWGDSAELVAAAHTLGIAHPPGYPLYTLLGAAAVRVPLGAPFFRMSLMSAVFGAAAAGVVALLVWVISGFISQRRDLLALIARSAGTVLAGAAFAVSPTLWSQATVPEVYTLSCFLVFSALLALVIWLSGGTPAGGGGEDTREERPPFLRGDRPLYLAGLLLGLGLAHHLTAALLVPSFLLCVFARARRRSVGKAIAVTAGVALACLSLYLYLPLRASQDPAIVWTQADTLDGFLYHVTAAQYASRLFAAPGVEVAHNAKQFAAALPSQTVPIVLALAAAGLLALWRRSKIVFGVLVLEAILVFLHAINYRIPDLESYYVPVYGIVSVCSGVGLFWLFGAAARLRGLRATGLVAVLVIACLGISEQVRWDWPERDLRDRTEAADYVERLLGVLAADAVVLARNDRTIFPLWYARFVEGRRRDVAVVDLPARPRGLRKWFPDLALPTEDVIQACLARSQARYDYPPGRERLQISDYAPLLVSLNEGARPIYADVDLGARVMPRRAVPNGLVVKILGDTLAAAPRADSLLARSPWREYLSELASARSVSKDAARVYARTLASYGRLYLARGDIGSAIVILERATELAPDLVQAVSNLGVAYVQAGRTDDGLLEFGRALELSPGMASIRYNVSEVYRAIGDPVRAEGELIAAEKLDPRNARYKTELARFYENAGDLDRAEDWFVAAERVAPYDWGIKVAHGDFLARHRRYASAVAAYRRAEELNPTSPGIQRDLSRCYWMLERPDNAVAALRRSVELQPHNPGLKYDLAVMLWRSEKPREALALLDDVVRLLPSSPKAYAAKAAILGEMGRYEESRALFETAESLGANGRWFWDAWSSMEMASDDSVARGVGSE